MKTRFVRGIRHTSLLVGILSVTAGVLVATAPLSSGTSGAAVGSLAGTVTFSQGCVSGIGVGIAYDGANLWYTCDGSSTDLLRADPTTGNVTASYQIDGGLGALAYDATRNVLWAGWGGTNEGQITKISLDPQRNVTSATVAFNVCTPQAGDPGDACFSDIDDGLTYDGGSDALFLSPDTSTHVYHYHVDGTRFSDGDNGTGEFTWAGSSCYNSGLAIGDQLLFEGSDGCNHVWVVDKANPHQVVFDFNTAIDGDPNFRDEGLACDPTTFAAAGEQVMWSKEAYSPMRAHAFVIPNGSCGAGGLPVPTTVPYVALGDSYSSGEGNPPFIAGTDGPKDYCHRSPQAYPELLGTAYDLMPSFYACSGALTKNITKDSKDTEPPQLQEPGIDSKAGLVTLTIGGNDAQFSPVLTACIEHRLAADAYNSAIGPVARWLGLSQDPSCAHSATFVSSVNGNVDKAATNAEAAYQAVLNKVDPVNTSVIAADYPHLFPSDPAGQNCVQLAPFLTHDDQTFLNTAGDRLDTSLATAARQAGVNFVDVRQIFTGHSVCGSSGAWINGLSIASGAGKPCVWSVSGHCVIPGGAPVVGSFHPNADGHSSGYETAIANYISAATSRTPANFPRNPTPRASSQQRVVNAASATPATTMGELTVVPITADSASCEGTYQPGQQLTVTGSGFAPGTTVAVYASSAGLGSNGDAQVARLTADSAGQITGTMRIPLTATGFTPPGASAAMIFLNALGLGTDRSHLDDVAITGLTSHSNACGTVEPLAFNGFGPPIANPPAVNRETSGRTIPVTFTLPGITAGLSDVLATGYPQSAAISCDTAPELTVGDSTTPTPHDTDHDRATDSFVYLWRTDPSWQGCRELIVKLVDGSYHRALFQFIKTDRHPCVRLN